MGKSMKKSKQSAQRKNTTLNQVVLTEDDTLFGRVIKKLGNSQFQIQTTDKNNHGVEVNAGIMSKSMVRIDVGDIILVGRNESGKVTTYEILGSLDKKTVTQLKDAKRFHKSLFSDQDDDDDFFDRSEEVKEEEEAVKPKIEKGNKPVKKEKNLISTDDDDIDINAI